jgi:acetyl-CoA acetyltransferase
VSLYVPFEPDRELSGTAAIVGVGNTDYGFDYEVSRKRPEPPRHNLADRLAITAFERALADSGLRRADIDGLGVSYGLAWKTSPDHDPAFVADLLGIRPSFVEPTFLLNAGVIPRAVATLASKKIDTYALIYSGAMRSVRQTFGGDAQMSGPSSYYYYHPWGWSSQAGHWALMFTHYMGKYGATEADLGAVAVDLREKARLNENAIMRDPLTIEGYLNSRYVVSPMHLLDLCLVSDGAVCVILRRSEMAEGLRHVPILVSGWGRAEIPDQSDKFHIMVAEGLSPLYQEAGRQALEMAGVALTDIDHFEGYDASTILLVLQLEGYGFIPRGEGLARWKDGHMSLGGTLPVNTSGGLLSEAYMQSWNHVVEAVRQLRHVNGPRQVADASISMTSLSTTNQSFPMILSRGDI